jgi:hypothetical protein
LYIEIVDFVENKGFSLVEENLNSFEDYESMKVVEIPMVHIEDQPHDHSIYVLGVPIKHEVKHTTTMPLPKQ